MVASQRKTQRKEKEENDDEKKEDARKQRGRDKSKFFVLSKIALFPAYLAFVIHR